MWDKRLDQGHIYLITNNVNNKKYIGQTWYPLERRLSQHISQKKRGCPLLSRAIKKYGKEAFTIESLARFDSSANADLLEKYFISFHCSSDQQYGYNLTDGGQGERATMLEEVRLKISKSKKGQKPSQETKDKISVGNLIAQQNLSGESKKRLDASRAKKRKLTMDQAEQIRKEYQNGMKLTTLASIYNVSITGIYHIVNNNTYINNYEKVE